MLHFILDILPVLTLFHLVHLNLRPKYYKLLEPLICIQCKIGAFLDNSQVCPEETRSQSTPPKLNTRYYHRTVFISHEQKRVNSAITTYLHVMLIQSSYYNILYLIPTFLRQQIPHIYPASEHEKKLFLAQK